MKEKNEKLIQDEDAKRAEELRIKVKSDELLESIKEKKRQHLSRCSRFGMFLLFSWVEFMINWSTGLLSSASKEIKTSLHLTDTQFGYFALANSTGRVIGSFVNIPLLAYVNRKWLYAAWMLGKAIFLFGFKLSNNGYILMIMRHLIGFCHMPITNYFPIWIDQFGVSEYKSFFQSGFSAVIPIGKCSGYILHMIVGIKNWQNGFVISGIFTLIVTFIVALIPYKNFSRYVMPLRWQEDKEKYYVRENRCTVFYEDEPEEKKGKSCLEDLKDKMLVLLNPQTVLLLIIRLTLFGINTAIHFWFGDYVRNGLFIEDQKVISSVYSFLSMVSPILGMGLTLITSKIFGTYEGKHAHWVLVFFQVVTALFGISATLMTSLIPFAILLFIYFLANGCALPIAQGLLLYTSREDMKATVYSLSVLLTQLLSSGSFPILYGIINDKYKAKNPRFAMFLLMSLSGVVIIPMIILAILRVRSKQTNEETKEKTEEKETVKVEEKKNEVEKDIAEGNKEEAKAEKVQNTKDVETKGKKEVKEVKKEKDAKDEEEEEEDEEYEEEEDEKKDSNKNKNK